MFGAILGVVAIVFVVVVLGTFGIRQPAALGIIILAVGAVCVVLGFWPTWVIIVIAIIAGIFVFREITD